MCGIAGIAGFRDDSLVEKMTDAIIHRGPDDMGTFLNDEISLGMRRLSIIDLDGGHQPMITEDGKIALVFNGEIYNFKEIRSELEKHGYRFRTNSDTEVILHGYCTWGFDILNKLNGMFAIAIADFTSKPQLFIARDRFGVKPLYYYINYEKIIFASEIKAILEYKTLARKLNPQALDLYLKYRYVPGEECLVEGIRKLPAGTYMLYNSGRSSISSYYQVKFPEKKLNISFDEAVDLLGEHLDSSIKRRLVADVPVGAFLSGGVDSSIIVALMTRHHIGELNTFSVGFSSTKDEIQQASTTAKLLGTRHHEILCSDADFENIEEIVWHLDEPIGDAIVLPMYLLAKEARKYVKVVLAGEGADEVFGGYLFHKALIASLIYRNITPSFIRKLNRGIFSMLPQRLVGALFEYPAELGREGKKRIEEYLKAIEFQSVEFLYRYLITLFSENELQSRYNPEFCESLNIKKSYMTNLFYNTGSNNPIDSVLCLQFSDWLPDDILMKLDKMTMASSLEGREPFLDHELVEFVGSLPGKYKIKGWHDKRILREFAKSILPKTNAMRKKKPFYIPIDEYFRKPVFMRLFENFRDDCRLQRVFSKEYIRSLNLSNTTLLHSKQIFSLIILNCWLRIYNIDI